MGGLIGKRLRLARLFGDPPRPAICLAFDHGMQLGPVPGTEHPRALIATAVESGVDGIILTPGLLVRHADLLAGRERPVVILRLDQTTMWRVGGAHGYPEGHTRLVATVEEAVQMGADAVITYLFTCHRTPELESRSFEITAEVTRAARRLGIVHVCEPMAARGGIAETITEPELVAMNNRMAMELGADILKTDWTGDAESFAAVVETAGAPILVAGGPRAGLDQDVLRTFAEILRSGAAGVLFGRNIFQSPDPGGLMRQMRALLNDAAAPVAALGRA